MRVVSNLWVRCVLLTLITALLPSEIAYQSSAVSLLFLEILARSDSVMLLSVFQIAMWANKT